MAQGCARPGRRAVIEVIANTQALAELLALIDAGAFAAGSCGQPKRRPNSSKSAAGRGCMRGPRVLSLTFHSLRNSLR
jgi:hypothetical protein